MGKERSERFLIRCRRALLLFLVLRGTLKGLCTAGAIGFLCILIGLKAGVFSLGIVIAAFFLLLLKDSWPVIRMNKDSLAIFVDSAFPGLRDSAINSVQLGREHRSPHTPFSLSLIRAALVQAEERMGAFNPWNLFRGRDLVRSFLILLVFLFAYAALYDKVKAAFIPHTKGAQWSPLVGDIALTFRYPHYTGIPPRTVIHSTGDVEGVKGTEVELEAKPSSSVRDGRIVFDKGKEIPLKVQGDGRLKGQFVVIEDDSYRFSLAGWWGRRVYDSLAHSVTLREDNPPGVDIVSPRDGLMVKEGDQVQMVFRIRDDYGIGRVFLVIRHGSGESRVEIARPQDGTREFNGEYAWFLTDRGMIRPGKKLMYAIEAEDNDTISGPKSGRSPFFSIEVYSPRKRHEDLMAKFSALFEILVSSLGHELLLKPESIGKERYLMEVEKSEGRFKSLINGVEAILTEGKDDQYLDTSFRKVMSRASNGLRNVSAERKEILKKAKESSQGISPLKAFQGKIIAELEDQAISIDDLLRRQELLNVLDLGKGLLSHEELISLLEGLGEGRGDAKDLLEAIAMAREDLMDLYDKLSGIAKDAPDEYLNPEAMKNLNTTDLLGELEKIREKLEGGDVKGAMEAARTYLSSLNQLVASLEGMVEGSFVSGSSDAMARIGGVIRELEDIAADQRGIADETMKAIKAMRSSALGKKTSGLERFLRSEREKLARLKSLIPPLPAIVSDVEGCDSALSHSDLPEAYQRSIRSLVILSSLEASYMAGQKDDGKKAQLGAAKSLNEEIVRDIKDILYPRADTLEASEKEKFSLYSRRQSLLKKKTSELQGKLSEDKGSPFMPQGISDRMGEAGEAMGMAENSLKGLDPFSALPQEERAIQRLAEARESLEKAAQERGGRRPTISLGGGHGVMGDYSGRVEIPARDAYKVPRQYREEILKAMEDGFPERYKSMNKEYFERLLK